MGMAALKFGIPPTQFWKMTVPEFMAVLRYAGFGPIRVPTDEETRKLMELHPDTNEPFDPSKATRRG